MDVEIISVGNEVVFGHTVNTNAAYLARMLQTIGMRPVCVTAVWDEEEAIKIAAIQAIKRSKVVIFTGGLGPTPDDLTKEAVCKALGMTLKIVPGVLDQIKAYFKEIGREMMPNNVQQAAFPKEAKILTNHCGTAPGCWLETSQGILILLPGPPKELKTMFENEVMPLLKQKTDLCYHSLDIQCFGLGESDLTMRIQALLGSHGSTNVATYVGEGLVRVRITSYANTDEEAKEAVLKMKNQIEVCLEDFVIGYNEDRLEEKVVERLLERQYTISTVESCTGGLIAATLVNCSGVSSCFKESIVTYSNEAKMAYVNVLKDTLERFGAVSEETAREMAEGIRKRTQSDIGLSSTGIAGPSGGTATKPVGLVYIGIAMKEGTEVFKLQLNGTRQENRQMTVQHILYQLYKKLR